MLFWIMRTKYSVQLTASSLLEMIRSFFTLRKPLVAPFRPAEAETRFGNAAEIAETASLDVLVRG